MHFINQSLGIRIMYNFSATIIYSISKIFKYLCILILASLFLFRENCDELICLLLYTKSESKSSGHTQWLPVFRTYYLYKNCI
jgi:hypothetical protein